MKVESELPVTGDNRVRDELLAEGRWTVGYAEGSLWLPKKQAGPEGGWMLPGATACSRAACPWG